MSAEKENLIFTIIATVIIIVGFIIGLGFFGKQTMAILTTACIFILPCLPFYYLYTHRRNTERFAIRFEIEEAIKEYAEELEYLVSEIEDYDPQKDNESPMEYLDGVKEAINSVAGSLKTLHTSLESGGDLESDKIA